MREEDVPQGLKTTIFDGSIGTIKVLPLLQSLGSGEFFSLL